MINYNPTSSSLPHHQKQNPPFLRTDTVIDLERSISKNYLSQISDSLFHKEIQAMATSNNLIDELEKNRETENKKCLFSTRSQISTSTSLEDWRRNDEERRLITRKSPKAVPREWEIQRCLKDVQENCSRTTQSMVKSLIEDSKRMKKTIIQLQSADKGNQIKIRQYQNIEKEMLMFKNQVSELYGQINFLKKDKKQLKSSDSNKSGDKLFYTEHLNSLKSFILAKESFVDKKNLQLSEISRKIEKIFQHEDLTNSCSKCCGFLKKIKESLISYRSYLENQEEQLHSLFEECKKILIFH